MSAAQVKDQVWENADGRCSSCGMSDHHHLLLTGRSLHIHRTVPGEEYTVEQSRCFCLWCHCEAHGQAAPTFPRKFISPFGTKAGKTELCLPYFPKAEMERLDTLADALRMNREEAIITALALLQIEMEKKEIL